MERHDELLAEIRTRFPHGHPAFLPILLDQIKLHSDKNHDYATGGHTLGNFTRVAAILKLYPNLSLGDERVVALVYALKQFDAVLWGLSEGIEHKVEGLNGRLDDISVYSNLVQCMNHEREAYKTPTATVKIDTRRDEQIREQAEAVLREPEFVQVGPCGWVKKQEAVNA